FGVPLASKEMLVYFFVFSSCGFSEPLLSSLEHAKNNRLAVNRNRIRIMNYWFYEYPTTSPTSLAVVQSVMFTFTKSPALSFSLGKTATLLCSVLPLHSSLFFFDSFSIKTVTVFPKNSAVRMALCFC